ncbi:hypothetical protein C8F04DRAFT_397419 [Mycena alexandri]|uniref:BTB domain-containing protein n=1 Tax=Mycena alexandri TaxID=1745969 RepID=A0AAD6T1U7_9AGAR|nr:hypothetical protein C8F04DRAFT_397419 [Mycena alexandri]
MADEHRVKRQRTDSDVDADAEHKTPPLVRSTEYWFDDGNIILQVESTQFRLTKSMLSMHSSVFRDMFTIPLPADEPTIENCPVVILSGDTAEDWILLLGVIYPKFYLGGCPSARLLAAMSRLSKKYDFPLFRKDCVSRLKQEFPTILKKYDKTDWNFIKSDSNTFLLLISLAREIGLHSILPQLYCSITTLFPNKYLPKILDPADTSLAACDRLACLLGHTNLLRLQATTTLAWLNFNVESPPIPAEDCCSSSDCTDAAKAIFISIFSPEAPSQLPEIWILNDWNKEWDSMLCSTCRRKAKEIYNVGRETCWQELPAAFGLPAWEELKSLDFE